MGVSGEGYQAFEGSDKGGRVWFVRCGAGGTVADAGSSCTDSTLASNGQTGSRAGCDGSDGSGGGATNDDSVSGPSLAALLAASDVAVFAHGFANSSADASALCPKGTQALSGAVVGPADCGTFPEVFLAPNAAGTCDASSGSSSSSDSSGGGGSSSSSSPRATPTPARQPAQPEAQPARVPVALSASCEPARDYDGRTGALRGAPNL